MAADLNLILNGTPVPVYLGENTALALAAKNSAAASAAAALAAAGIGEYADTSAGLAGTTEDETFWVDNDDGVGVIYRHDTGPVATEIGRFVKDMTATGAAGQIGATGGTVQDALDAFSGANAETISATTYTILAADLGKLLYFTAGTSITITVPAGLPADFYCSITQGGLGQVTVEDDGTTTIVNADGEFSTEARYVRLALYATAADAFVLEGRTT